ncbi:MAG: TauD/TfdA family dioxygenase [Bdellovibrio bacteriovorus]
MSHPFEIPDNPSHLAAYGAWRDRRLAAYPATPEDLRVELGSLAAPSPAERAAIARRIALYNLALVAVPVHQITPEAILAFGCALGLNTADSNLFADHRAVSTIAAGGADERADYIPYTTKPLSWHTDGYYNPAHAQVRAWTLFCLRQASAGGVNSLLDPEIAYIHLRDQSPELVRALAHPRAFTIPANRRGSQVLRAESTGPVFSFDQGHLHMRYSARSRNVEWRATPETQAAREALDRLFSSPCSYIFTHTLRPGEGLVSNNVLHNRTGFADVGGPREGRLLYRVRYLERVAGPS